MPISTEQPDTFDALNAAVVVVVDRVVVVNAGVDVVRPDEDNEPNDGNVCVTDEAVVVAEAVEKVRADDDNVPNEGNGAGAAVVAGYKFGL